MSSAGHLKLFIGTHSCPLTPLMSNLSVSKALSSLQLAHNYCSLETHGLGFWLQMINSPDATQVTDTELL